MMQPCVWPLEYDAFECAYANSGALIPEHVPTWQVEPSWSGQP
jgi:hypothetical protein